MPGSVSRGVVRVRVGRRVSRRFIGSGGYISSVSIPGSRRVVVWGSAVVLGGAVAGGEEHAIGRGGVDYILVVV